MQSWLVGVCQTNTAGPRACTAVDDMCAAFGCSHVTLYPLSAHDTIYKPELL